MNGSEIATLIILLLLTIIIFFSFIFFILKDWKSKNQLSNKTENHKNEKY